MAKNQKLSQEQVMALARTAAGISGLPAELHFGMLMQESGGDPNAVSWAGAQGLAQFMPATAKRFGLKDPFDPLESAKAQGRYMKYLHEFFKGDADKAVMAYNAGEGNIQRGRIPKETKKYLPAVKAWAGFAAGVAGSASSPDAGPATGDGRMTRAARRHDFPPTPFNPFRMAAPTDTGPAEPVNPFDLPEHLMPEPAAGLPFTDAAGQKQIALPETGMEAERLARWARMDEEMRNRLIDLGQRLKPKESKADIFQTLPNDFDAELLELIDRV